MVSSQKCQTVSMRKTHQVINVLSFFTPIFWFLIGFSVALFTLMGIVIAYFKANYQDKVVPGVFVGNVYVGEMKKEEIKKLFDERNENIKRSVISYSYQDLSATMSADNLDLGYDANLIATQAINLGKSSDIFSNFYLILNSYMNGLTIPPSYSFNREALEKQLMPLQKKIYSEPVNAQFKVENNRVIAFQESKDGKTVNLQKALKMLDNEVSEISTGEKNGAYFTLPVEILKPEVTTEQANKFGIVEVIGQGNSTFFGSIPNRVHNVTLASNRVNGVLVAPDEEFSFAKAIGDVSKYTGYKEAYIIQNGKTILGDGGGVCQVSTTLFRAILNAGLPITERHAHAYRVGYYEQGYPPGLDATVYVPNIDLKFKNDTGNHILILSYVDPVNYSLEFTLYGKKDNRVIEITTPVITSQTPPPETQYQDDPTLPKGTEKQVEHAAWGANVVFSRIVTKDGKTIISETYKSRYTPWRAVFLRGTKEG